MLTANLLLAFCFDTVLQTIINMKFFGIVLFCTLALSVLATDPLTLTVGSTAYVMTGTQVAVAASAIAALAIAKETLILAHLGAFRGKGKRDLNSISQTPLHFGQYFDTIARADTDDCGKLLVCHSMAKSEQELNAEEKAITKLFDNLEVINPRSGYAEYQLAAYAGTFKQPEMCIARYSRCRTPVQKLATIIKSQ